MEDDNDYSNYYEYVNCSECGQTVCPTCGCCYNEDCDSACCPDS